MHFMSYPSNNDDIINRDSSLSYEINTNMAEDWLDETTETCGAWKLCLHTAIYNSVVIH